MSQRLCYFAFRMWSQDKYDMQRDKGLGFTVKD